METVDRIGERAPQSDKPAGLGEHGGLHCPEEKVASHVLEVMQGVLRLGVPGL